MLLLMARAKQSRTLTKEFDNKLKIVAEMGKDEKIKMIVKKRNDERGKEKVIAEDHNKQVIKNLKIEAKLSEEEKIRKQEIVITGQQQQREECALLLLLARAKQSSKGSGNGKLLKKLKIEAGLGEEVKIRMVAEKLKTKSERLTLDGTKAAQQQSKL